MSNRLRVQAAVSEFLHAWTCGGKADLHLDTSEGGAPSPSLPTLAIQVLSSFPPLLQLLPSHRGRADKERNGQRPPAHQAAQRAAEQTSVIPTSQSFPVISCAAPVSAASTPSPTSAVFLPASASVAPNSTPAYASVASSPLPAASSSSTVTAVSALSSAPVMSNLFCNCFSDLYTILLNSESPPSLLHLLWEACEGPPRSSWEPLPCPRVPEGCCGKLLSECLAREGWGERNELMEL